MLAVCRVSVNPAGNYSPMMTDPIADMLTRVRNGALVRKREVVVPFSKLKLALATILLKAGYLGAVEQVTSPQPAILIKLKYEGGTSAIAHAARISKPGARHYVKNDDLAPVLGGYGLRIISTSQGLMTDAEARAKKLGGEVLCEIY